MMFAKLKTLLCKAGERSIAAVWHRINQLLEEFFPSNAPTPSGMQETLQYKEITL